MFHVERFISTLLLVLIGMIGFGISRLGELYVQLHVGGDKPNCSFAEFNRRDLDRMDFNGRIIAAGTEVGWPILRGVRRVGTTDFDSMHTRH
jgi:hypothetical protein